MAWRFGLAAIILLGTTFSVHAQQVHRNPFEGFKVFWVKGAADALLQETNHVMSDQGAHDGQRAELLQFTAQQGTHIHYHYPIGKGLLTDEFTANLWIKANRPDLQLMARLVLPNERDPANLETRLTTVIRGDKYRNVGRWQRLEVGRVVSLAKQQQQILQAAAKRPLNFADAYIDSLVLNVYGGPGNTEVWIDDLEVGPVLPEVAFQPTTRPTTPMPLGDPVAAPAPQRHSLVEYNGSHLLVGGKKFLVRGIRYTDTPLRILRDAGFNTLFIDYTLPPHVVKEATDLGFWLVPEIRVLSDDPRLATPEGVAREVSRFATNEAVLFWNLGGPLKFEQAVALSRSAQLIKAADPGRPLAGEVQDGLLPFSRTLNLVGIQRYPLASSFDLLHYREWSEQRRRLTNLAAYTWTTLPTHLPEPLVQQLYERSSQLGFAEPVGPQPEQLRLMTYLALASGFKGVCYSSDRWLADSHQGRDRLLACALLNLEMDMLEPLLVLMDDPPQWIDTSVPEIKAAVVRTPKGILVLPIWMGTGSQFVPGQAAAAKVTMVVPQIPQSMHAWDVTPGDVRSLKAERVVGGTKLVLHDFGLTATIVFTNDLELVGRFQKQAMARRQVAAQYTYDMALYELEKTVKLNEQLASLGHPLPEAQRLLGDAQDKLRDAKQLWDTRVFGEAYREANRALRPARIVLRAHWDRAVKGLDSPVASPYATTAFSLPRHWQFLDQVTHSVPGSNVLPGGDFELIPERVQDTWKLEESLLDDVEPQAIRVGDSKGGSTEVPHQGKQCVLLQLRPKNPKLPIPATLERSTLALVSPEVKLAPGTLVQITGWVRIPAAIRASADGVLVYDSAGGEPLGVRWTEPTPWKKFTLYRRVPASGSLKVTLALTGLGSAYFDDVRIEPLVPGGVPVSKQN